MKIQMIDRDGLVSDEEIPDEVFEAARLLGTWMTTNGKSYWSLMECCDRRFADELDE